MTLNIYKRIPGKPMVYSYESATNFLLQTKNTMIIPIKGGYVKIRDLYVGIFENVDEWTDLEKEAYRNGDAVKWVFQHRQFINWRFKD